MGKKGCILAVAALWMTGCAPVFVDYRPNPPAPNPPQRKLRVAVAPFEGLASETDEDNAYLGMSSYIGMGGLGFPSKYSQDNYFSPACAKDPNARWRRIRGEEGSDRSKSCAECLLEELRASGLFAGVDFKDWSELADSPSQYDLILTGRLFYDHRHGSFVNVGIPLNMVQMILPLVPTGSAHRELALEIEALDPDAPGRPLWKRFVWMPDDAGGVTYWWTGGADLRRTRFMEHTPRLIAQAFLGVRDDLAKELSAGGSLDQWASAKAGR